ncbi:hypothetical protein Lalb_Chr10g0092701 [Lupinus albus]|uniref:Uncharacterized protein n=1 Tax=Lupinus albus TaxID=3870 RepID=A0A6A4PU62_LUPAL|nr:hypothetical protein Lalb_Chr10g0092701 [Lupinus albus]
MLVHFVRVDMTRNFPLLLWLALFTVIHVFNKTFPCPTISFQVHQLQ